MCLNSDNVNKEELALVETLAKSMGEGSALGTFLQDIVTVLRGDAGICLGIPQDQPQPPGWGIN